MLDRDFLGLVKQAAVEAVYAEKPAGIFFGQVERQEPLTIRINQEMALTGSLLLLPESLTDYAREVSYGGEKVTVTVHGALKAGEHVVLLRSPGGRQYIVLGRC